MLDIFSMGARRLRLRARIGDWCWTGCGQVLLLVLVRVASEPGKLRK
jgi:hypothetical protein